MDFVRTALFCSATAALGSYAAVAWAARAQGRSLAAPANATSHWLHGPAAGRRDGVDLAHTGMGLATHVASAAFWAVPYAVLQSQAGDGTANRFLRDGVLTAAAAAVLDYGIIPRRLSPGWEHALAPRHVAAGFAGLALGLAVGAWLAQMTRPGPVRSPRPRATPPRRVRPTIRGGVADPAGRMVQPSSAERPSGTA